MKKHSLLLVLGILIISLVMIGCDNGSGGGSTGPLTIAGKTVHNATLALPKVEVGPNMYVGDKDVTVTATEVEGSGTKADPWVLSFKVEGGGSIKGNDLVALREYFKDNTNIAKFKSLFTITNGDAATLGGFSKDSDEGTISSNGVTYHLKIPHFG